jgi:hypothetical protein
MPRGKRKAVMVPKAKLKKEIMNHAGILHSSITECKILQARDKMFPSPDRLVWRHPGRVAESFARPCYCVCM